MSEHPVVIENLVKHFGTTRAVDGVSLVAEQGSVLGLLGPNGAGKTTVVRMLATLLAPDAGHARVMGYDVRTQPNEVRRSIGLTGQYAAVDELLTGAENLAMVGRLYGLSRADARARAAQLLEQFDLVEAGSRLAKTYSGGMRRRLDLAASLITGPPVIFLDEPTTGLDPRSRMGMWDVISRLVDDGTTVLLTTQYLEEADKLANRIVVIDHGVVIAEGTPDDLKSQVGGSTLTVRVTDALRADTIQQALAGAAVNAVDDEVSVSLSGSPDQLAELLSKLSAVGATLDDITLTSPTMDDVFLSLTGKASE